MAFRGMRFCKECDNMLQPKEEKVDEEGESRLIYFCRICGNSEKAKPMDQADNCVYQSEVAKDSASETKVDKECIKDPTLTRNRDVQCPKCPCHEAVSFTNPTKQKMALVYVCTKCAHSWIKSDKSDSKEQVKDQ